MTFRSAGRTIEKRIKDLTNSSGDNNKLNRVFARFLDEYFPEGKDLVFEVSILNGKITIRTSNKAVANELVLKISELSKIFMEEGIKSSQIIIN